MKHDIAAIRERHPLVDVVARYVPELKKLGKEYVGHCPFHRDSDPSLTVWRGRDGVQRFRCFPCGTHGDVVDFIREIESVDFAEAVRRLEGAQMPMPNTREPRELPVNESDCWDAIVPVPADALALDLQRVFNPNRPTNADGTVRWVGYRPEHVAEWRNAAGELVGYVLRLVIGDKKVPVTVTWCAGPHGATRWTAKRPPAPFPFVGSEALAGSGKKPIVVVEGEKKREAAARAMPAFVWLSLYGGADGVSRMDVAALAAAMAAGRQVYLWPDADPPGRRAMRALGERLAGVLPA